MIITGRSTLISKYSIILNLKFINFNIQVDLRYYWIVFNSFSDLFFLIFILEFINFIYILYIYYVVQWFLLI